MAIRFTQADRDALKEASVLLETVGDDAPRAAWLAGRLAGLSGRPVIEQDALASEDE